MPAESPHFLAWQGDISHFEETGDGGWLLDSPDLSGEASVYMPVDAPASREYSFLFTAALNPSSRNYARFYLWSDSPDTQAAGEAFFIRLGYTGDHVCLCRQAGGSAPEVWIAGREKLLDADWSEVHVRLTVDASGTFRLFTRLESEPAETEEGRYVSRDPLPLRSGYLILNCKFTNKGRNAFAFEQIAVRASGSGDEPDHPAEGLPAVTEVHPLTSRSLFVLFDRNTDISKARFTLSGEAAAGVTAAGGARQITLTFRNAMQSGTVYRLAWEKVRAENGSAEASGSFDFTYDPSGTGGDDPGEPDTVHPADLVINEILYDPFSGGSEYFEVYNRTLHALSVAGLSVAVRRQDGTLSTAYSLSEIKDLLEPGAFRAFTRSKAGVTAYYSVPDETTIGEVKKLPALANAGATLVLFDTTSREVIDEVAYAPSWHNPLLPATRGVSLERLSADAPSGQAANWASAAATAGYGTPGYRNSQSGGASESSSVSVSAPLWQPAAGTYDIAYTLDKAGYKCRSEVYDLAGRLVAGITVDETVGLSGTLRWDGKGKSGKRLISGLYLYYAEFFHSDGTVHRFKKAFPVAE